MWRTPFWDGGEDAWEGEHGLQGWVLWIAEGCLGAPGALAVLLP